MVSEAASEAASGALTSPDPALLKGRRRYHVALTPSEVVERLAEQPGVQTYTSELLPDFGGLIADADYTVELTGSRGFMVHCGPPAARGQSATGMLRLLYLRGRLERTDEGTQVLLSFAYRRPRWAMQRWVGFLTLASLGLVWVLIGPGVLAKKALLYGALLLVLGPVIAHDLRRGDRVQGQRIALLNLMEQTLGPIQLEDGNDEPYRRRQLSASFDEEDEEDEDNEDDEQGEEDERDKQQGGEGDGGDNDHCGAG